MKHEFPQPFAQPYESLLKRLKLRGMQPKTIEAYSHGVRRAAAHFDYRIDDLNKNQLTDYFAQILDQLSWSTLKHNLYGLKFYYAYVLGKPWPCIRPPGVSATIGSMCVAAAIFARFFASPIW